MADTNSNVATLKAAYARWNESKGASVEHWMGLLADDIKFGSLAAGAVHLAFTKSYDNKQAVRDYFAGLAGDWDMIHYTVNEYIAQGDLVAARGSTSWKNKRTGKIFATPKMDFWRFRDGTIVEFFEFYDTAGVQAAAMP
jgi:ketosteroid isomerase-like protein